MGTQRQLVRYAGLVAAILCIASLADAQTTEKKTLTLQGAERVIAAAKEEAQKLHSPGGVIAHPPNSQCTESRPPSPHIELIASECPWLFASLCVVKGATPRFETVRAPRVKVVTGQAS